MVQSTHRTYTMASPSISTQQFVEIREIRDNVIYLKGGGMRKVIIVSGVNFDLKSEDEQGLILSMFQNFLNSLDFPVQFFIHSRKVNVGEYLERMRLRKKEETNELLKIQIDEYTEFIRAFVEHNSIINKSFFVIVPYDSTALSSETKGFFSGLFGKKPATKEQQASDRENLEQLDHRVSQVTEGLSGIGLRAAQLANEEIVELFYNLYNPQFVERKDLQITKQS